MTDLSKCPYPNLLSTKESADLLKLAEQLWTDLQANKIGGFSGHNRPFFILHEFKRVIEEYGGRDVGLRWSNNDLDAAAADGAIPPLSMLEVPDDSSLHRLLEEIRKRPPTKLCFEPAPMQIAETCERIFAWWPVRLVDNRRWWLRPVYRITTVRWSPDGPVWSTSYSLTIPENAL